MRDGAIHAMGTDPALIDEVMAMLNTWTPEKVSERLIEAFRIDARMPRIERPKAPGSAHPTIEYDNDDRAEWQTEEIDASKFRPSVEEEEIAAEAFSWLLFVISPKEREIAKNWCRDRARGISLRSSAKKASLHVDTMRLHAERAFSAITSRLNDQSASA